ncbi:MAG: hypothetical protein DWQ44_11265 [Bacteroidetes bacterium]|nr:MAG: hypothetical protein DWQ33_09385 [Bacteroidota bacterium]REK05201.1 MAG: hypothetical protein DWQ39_08395 [Bacteroidota bacterium]REK32606.1 MAG: hypothetical protein DWQ44_11265 [Bacteroidota bacterium]REK48947.1 MAG: hypothetical protein DWQ48_08695 [Bacteroidota bacterium]
MEETSTSALLYQKGFNEGYIIAKHIQNFSFKTNAPGIRTKGFIDGQKQFIIERDKNRLPDWLKSSSNKTINKENNPSKKRERGMER